MIKNETTQATNNNEGSTMTINRYQPRISKESASTFYALIVRVDSDGQESVIHGYKGRYFQTMKAATKSTINYIAKHNLND